MKKLVLIFGTISLCLTSAAQANTVACSDILSSLLSLKSSVNSVNQTQYTFLSDLSNVLNSWYAEMSSHEGRTSTIPVGEFTPVKQQADTLQTARDNFRNNTDGNDGTFNDIIAALPGCLKQ